MSRPTSKLMFWLSLPFLVILFTQGCGGRDYKTSSSSQYKLEHWVPQDPSKNQKPGVCCFVYDKPDESPPLIATRIRETPPAPAEAAPRTQAVQDSKSSLERELADTKRALAASEQEKADLAKEKAELANLLAAARMELATTKADLAAKSALENEKADLMAQLAAAKTELGAKSTADQEKADLARQLKVAQAELAAKSAVENEKSELAAQLDTAQKRLAAKGAEDTDKLELAKQLEAAKAEIEKNRLAQSELRLRLTEDKDNISTARQLQEARVGLNPRSEEQNRAAEFARQLEAAQAELAAKATIEKEKEDLARKLEDTRAALAQKAAREAELDKAVKSMEKALKEEIGQGSGSIRRGEDSFTVELTDRILFDSGSAAVKPEGLKVLQRVANSLKQGADKTVRIEGHTDDVPIRKSPPPRFRSNWELSAARAGNVAEYLEKDVRIKPEQLSAAGYSYTRPLVANESNEARARNRRVEIIITPAQSTSAMAPTP